MTDVIFYLICGGAAVVMAVYYLRRRHRLSSALFGSISGISALLLLNFFGEAFGAQLPLNVFNVCGSLVLGAPFVASLVIITHI